MPVIGSVTSVALTGKREGGTIYNAASAAPVVAAVQEIASASAEANVAVNARISQLEGALDQIIGLLQAQSAKPVVAEPLSVETVKELTPAEKAAITRAEKKAAAEAGGQVEEESTGG